VEKLVYFFAKGQAEGSAKMKDLLGGKGANLAEMTNMGIPVPPGFTITTEACLTFLREGGAPAEVHHHRVERAGEAAHLVAVLHLDLGAEIAARDGVGPGDVLLRRPMRRPATSGRFEERVDGAHERVGERDRPGGQQHRDRERGLERPLHERIELGPPPLRDELRERGQRRKPEELVGREPVAERVEVNGDHAPELPHDEGEEQARHRDPQVDVGDRLSLLRPEVLVFRGPDGESLAERGARRRRSSRA